jgi:SPP1 gp7 family putative phage head morphogenesis protein
MPEPKIGNVPFQEAIDFFRNKHNISTTRWDALRGEAHARMFTVAGATKGSVLTDIRAAVDDALANGTTITEFRKQFDKTVAKNGWDFTGKRGWRTRTIFDTNLRSAHAAGRWQQVVRRQRQLQARNPDEVLYLVYETAGDQRVRPQHRAWDRIIRPVDDPFWDTHYPPNGWGCRCIVRSLTRRQLEREGLVPTADKDLPETLWQGRRVGLLAPQERLNRRTGEIYPPTPAGIDVGFGHNVGKKYLEWDARGRVPDCLPGFEFARGPRCISPVSGQPTWKEYRLPDLRRVSTELKKTAPPLLSEASSRSAALATMHDALGLSETRRLREIRTPINELVWISTAWSEHWVEKLGDHRERFANFVVPTLADPYEVWWTRYADGMRSRYIGLFTGDVDLAVIVRRNLDGSILWNILNTDARRLNKQRQGWLLYVKGEE